MRDTKTHQYQHSPSSERSVQWVLDMHNIEPPDMLLPVHNNARPSHVTPARNHHNISCIKFDEICNLALVKVIFDGVVGIDWRIRITNRATIVGDDMWDTFGAYRYFADLEELVGGFFGCDAVDCETAFDVVQQAEMFARFFNGDDICSFVRNASSTQCCPNAPIKPPGYVSSVLTFPSTLIKRCLTIAVTSRPVKAYFSLLRRKMVRGRDSRSLWGPGDGRGACQFTKWNDTPGIASNSTHICPAQLVEHPWGGRGKALQVLFGSSSLIEMEELAWYRRIKPNAKSIQLNWQHPSHSDGQRPNFRIASKYGNLSNTETHVLTMMEFLRSEGRRRVGDWLKFTDVAEDIVKHNQTGKHRDSCHCIFFMAYTYFAHLESNWPLCRLISEQWGLLECICNPLQNKIFG